MHQLCNEINIIGTQKSDCEVSAFMLYMQEKRGQACHVKNAMPLSAYSSIYPNIKVCTNWESFNDGNDENDGNDGNEKDVVEYTCMYSSSLVIWPEIWTNLMDGLKGNHQNSIWWLSVNNNSGKFQQWDRKDILHLYQSEYAKCHIVQHLQKAKCVADNEDKDKDSWNTRQVLPITEYIPQRHSHSPNTMKELPRNQDRDRDLEILYNPLKGIHYTDAIRNRSDKKFQFTPIGGSGEKRLSPAQVTQLLHRAKVYMDFGPHPGMDRLPREAAMADCIVITNREGAAFYKEDVPIPSVYKIGDFDAERIHGLLKKSVEGYEEKKADFDSYREWIAGQKVEMESCVKGLINIVVTERL